MNSARGYRWGALLFGLVAICCLAVLPHAITCCSRFSPADLKYRAQFGANGWEPGITSVAVALLDWPMGFRLLLMTLVAAIVCFGSCLTGLLVVRGVGVDPAGVTTRSIAKSLLASLMAGVLYMLAVYAAGFIGYLGPANLFWMIGVPAVIAIVTWPRLTGILMTIPVGIGGFIALAAISIAVGIPLD